DHPDVAGTLNNLANVYEHQGKYVDAERFHRRALAIREAKLGPDHPDVAASLTGLAIVYEDQRKYVDAERFYQRALAIREAKLGPDDDIPITAPTVAGTAISGSASY